MFTDLSGRVIFCNDAAKTLFGSCGSTWGWCHTEGTGMPWWPAPDTERAAAVQAGHVWFGELPVGRHDGADLTDRADVSHRCCKPVCSRRQGS